MFNNIFNPTGAPSLYPCGVFLYHKHTHTYITYIHVHTYIHTYTHTIIHTYTHAHTMLNSLKLTNTHSILIKQPQVYTKIQCMCSLYQWIGELNPLQSKNMMSKTDP